MLDMVEAESQITILTKKLDDSLTAQNIASEALEVANGENCRLTAEASARHEEVLKLKSDLEETLKDNAEIEAEKEDLAKKLQDADSNFIANFHLTEAYTNFSNYFGVGQQEGEGVSGNQTTL
ncbi:hypothetical protein Fot_42895 [Forsythia ovata]|uniref:Uncharacterized protein n=1 Tax=Forsythia ovata TaxID=205694 RepID=A0ABD1RMH1_9LAMI